MTHLRLVGRDPLFNKKNTSYWGDEKKIKDEKKNAS